MQREEFVSPEPAAGRARLRDAAMFALGPIMGLLFICAIPLLSLVVVLTLLARVAVANESGIAEEAGMCLSCHSEKGVFKTLGDGSRLGVHVDAKHFKGSAHEFLSCTGCHDVSMDSHPSKTFASRREFSLSVSSACRVCHPDEQLKLKPMHMKALSRANAPPCSDCHGSHSIGKVSEWKKPASTSEYCITCHGRKISTSIHGEELSLTVNEKALRGSVHSSHNCSDCHRQFSKDSHPIINFGSRRELTVSISETCGGCHPQKLAQVEGSIHYSMLQGGNLEAPVCADCHGFHEVGRKAITKTLSGVPCKKCHDAIFEDYKASVHGQAVAGGKNAAMCSSCHFAHEVRPALLSESPKGACFACHENAIAAHSKWLPNAEAHFGAVACTACHVPDAGKTVYISPPKNSPAAIEAKAKAGGIIGEKLLWDIYLASGKGGSRFGATIGLSEHGKSHSLAPKFKAVKKCDSCHDADSETFKSVAMSFVDKDGREEFYAVKPEVLASIFSLLPLGEFYALGGTRIKLFDYLGILMVFGGASFPALHITARLLTRRLRRQGGPPKRGHGPSERRRG